MNKREFIKTLIDISGWGAKQGTWDRGWAAAISDAIAIAEELDEPETLSEEWIENHTASADTISYYSEDSVPVVTVSNLKGLLVPKQDKPEKEESVISNIAGFLTEYHYNCGVWGEKEVIHAIDKELTDYYDVKKEKKKYYVVDSDDGCILQRNTDTEYDKRVAYPEEGRLLKHIIDHNEELLYQFTEQEIKDYDERYWAFAEEVTE